MNKVRAMDLAKYIVAYEKENNRKIDNLRLQKLLYFVQAKFLNTIGEPIFDERIEAWTYGPVVPDVYHEFKKYSKSDISYNADSDSLQIDDMQREYIEGMLTAAAEHTTNSLIDISHRQTPWIESYACGVGSEITNDSIKKYFKS